MLGLTVSKTIEETNCDLNVAVPWPASAKYYLINVNDFSNNQFVLGKKTISKCFWWFTTRLKTINRFRK